MSDFFRANILNWGLPRQIWWRKPIMEPGNSGTKHTRDIKRLQRFIRRHVRSSCARIQRLRHWMIFLGKRSVSGQRNPGQSGTQTRFCRHRASAGYGKDCQFGLHGGGSETCRWRDRCVLLYSGNTDYSDRGTGKGMRNPAVEY